MLLQNNIPMAIPLLKRALEELHAQRHEMLNMDFVCDLGAALAELGQHEEALTLMVNAIESRQRGGKFLHMPALLRMKGPHPGVPVGRGLSRSRRKLAVIDRLGETPVRHPV